MRVFKIDDDTISWEYDGYSFEFSKEDILSGGDTIGSFTSRGRELGVTRTSHYGTLFIAAMGKEIKTLQDNETALLDTIFQTFNYLRKYTSDSDDATHANRLLLNCVMTRGTTNQKIAAEKIARQQTGL